ncbi:hypothetical protein GYM62_02135 [Algoriphagus sp. NBT04N3]|nr:hypothetical protein [Algoriphagus sp. NBT04N3]QYH41154.1 hypothetical protein GYM62_02135 [Algoriphagus sp. NBT04N3]
MFDSPDYPRALSEKEFNSWMEKGRQSLISYSYLLIFWDEMDEKYLPIFVENRNEIQTYERYGDSPGRQLLVAAYDLHSESRVA